ncbi:MAG TPA: methionyl-tRNA formyltransferase [Candidatus Polarisedimenticolaceae bacterium]|nr:methionyl-tRNA formyltransferase [Candidatus Polarisedimenticolaceae bacterium]
MKPPLVFFGTGPVSLHCLEGVYPHFDIEAIITKPDRKAPDGKSHPHPVRTWSEDHAVPVFQVNNSDELKTLWGSHRFISRTGLVVDFGMTIPEPVIDSFELGIINSHFSLLPLLRGADPISFAILEGLPETGVSLMRIVPRMDEGDLLSQQSYPIPEAAATPDLTKTLGELSNRMLIRDLPRYIEGKMELRPQDSAINPTYSRKLTKQDGKIDWAKPAVQLDREVRAFTPWPGSHTRLYERDVTITATHVLVGEDFPDTNAVPGTIATHASVRLIIAAGEGWLAIDRLKPAGKREMAGADFVRGYSKP